MLFSDCFAFYAFSLSFYSTEECSALGYILLGPGPSNALKILPNWISICIFQLSIRNLSPVENSNSICYGCGCVCAYFLFYLWCTPDHITTDCTPKCCWGGVSWCILASSCWRCVDLYTNYSVFFSRLRYLELHFYYSWWKALLASFSRSAT